jgi:two-component system OmpR family sensor kinase
MVKESLGPTAELVHELQAPLTVLRARLEAGIESSSCNSECKQLLRQCLDEVNEINQTVVDMLLLEKADSGRLVVEPSPCDLSQIVSAVGAHFEPLSSSRGVDLGVDVEQHLYIKANEGHLRRVLSNVVDNALKYTPEGGQVSIEVRRSDTSIEVRIADTGCGVPADALEHIFERFYRVAGHRETAGVGLGLSIARALARINGGTVEVKSTEGKGSCFTLRFPASEAPLRNRR